MKCAVASALLLACCAVLLGDASNPANPARPGTLLDDLVRMTKAGSSEVDVLAYAKAHRIELAPRLSDSSLRFLRASGVGTAVVAYMAAIDVRALRNTLPEGVSAVSSERDGADADRAGGAYASAGDETETGDAGAEDLAGAAGYPDDSGTYAAFDSGDSFYAYPDPYTYLSFGYPYFSVPAFFFADRAFRRFPHRDGRFGGGHRGRDFHDAWRERGSRGGREAARTIGPRGPVRRSSGRNGFVAGPRGSRAAGAARRGYDVPGRARGLASGFRGHRGGAGAPGFARSAPPAFAGRGFGRAGSGAAGFSGGGYRTPGRR